uniref:Lipid-binding serum glycoprotein C-terminal domain-containing protein n=1 Tax=Chenopodium quinoa TaxID=63459 RepID=A0A803LXY5_CHEQI
MTSSKMDEELRNAAVRGDVDFLKHCVESNKPIEYYLTFYPEEDDQSGRRHHGNIFHMAATENQEEFIREAMGILPQEAKHQLLVQTRGISKWNPLHVAAKVDCKDIIQDVNKIFTYLVSSTNNNNGGNPLHYLARYARCTEDATKIAEMLIDIYKKESPSLSNNQHPWLVKNIDGDTPLSLAIAQKNVNLAIYLLSVDENVVIESKKNVLFLAVEVQCHTLAEEILKIIDNKGWTQLLTNHQKLNILHLAPLCTEHSTLFLAIQNNCSEVAKAILGKLDKRSRTKYLKDSSTGRNILHLATSLTDVSFGTWLVDIAPEFITQKHKNGQSPWDKAFEFGHAWFIKAVLEKDSSVFSREPLAWTKACEKGHVPALCAFIDHNPGAFRDLCIEKKDSPLHHIKLSSLTNYEEFLKIPRMKDLINLQDSQGVTPLHKAIQDDNLFLTETLLSIDKINYDIKDDGDNSAIDLLAQKCADNQAWICGLAGVDEFGGFGGFLRLVGLDRMCKRIGLDPRIKTTYFRTKTTNLLDVRNSLFVVAALLATITFTAGFTLPGGFTQDSGEAILAKKAAFLVFLVSNTLALFFSMLVLICLIWSMVLDPIKSLILIDRSMVLLLLALNCTLLAFMTGVYTVIAPKSLWAAILIIVIMSSLIGISINKTLLYRALEYIYKLFPSQMGDDEIRIKASKATANLSMDWKYTYQNWFVEVSDQGIASVEWTVDSGHGFFYKLQEEAFGEYVQDMEAGLKLSLENHGGGLKLSLLDSRCEVDDVDIKLDGGASWLYQGVVDAFSDHIESAVENAIVKKLNEGISKIGSLLQSLPTEIKVDESSALNVTFVGDPTLSDSSIGFVVNGLFIPRNGALATPHQHRILQISVPCYTPAKMIAMSLHEDVFNSAALVYFNAGLMEWRVDKIPDQSLLNTSEWKEVVPQLYEQYPNAKMALDLSVASPPYVHVFDDKMEATINAEVTINVVSDGEAVPIACGSVVISASGSVVISGNNLTGSIELDKFNLSAKWSKIGDLQIDVIEPVIAEVLKDVLLPQLNTRLIKGFPLPLIHGFTLQDAEIVYSDSVVTVCSNVAFTEDQLLAKYSFRDIFSFHLFM